MDNPFIALIKTTGFFSFDTGHGVHVVYWPWTDLAGCKKRI